MLINLEIGLMTEPFGLFLFVMQGVMPNVKMKAIHVAALPFLLIDIATIGVLMVVPDIAMGLTRLVS